VLPHSHLSGDRNSQAALARHWNFLSLMLGDEIRNSGGGRRRRILQRFAREKWPRSLRSRASVQSHCAAGMRLACASKRQSEKFTSVDCALVAVKNFPARRYWSVREASLDTWPGRHLSSRQSHTRGRIPPFAFRLVFFIEI
jgi:hypothetical protein